jgi:protein-tyrosine phosphatase
MNSRKKKILNLLSEKENFSINFICSGNIIRSPYAEILFEKLIADSNEGLVNKILVESGGVRYRNSRISNQTKSMLLKEGISKERIHRFTPRFFPDFPDMFEKNDLILVMEQSHLTEIPSKFTEIAFLLLEFTFGKREDVPDPYFDPPYERVYNILKKALFELNTQFLNALEA